MYKKIGLCLILTSMTIGLQAKNIEYGDPSCQTANPQLIDLVEKVAQEIGHTDDYELVEPTSLGLLMNPYNRMMFSVVNPGTGNDLILINFEWLNGLDLAAQKFLISRNFAKLQFSKRWTLVRMWPYLFILINILLVLVIFLIFTRTLFKHKSIFINAIFCFAFVYGLEVLILNKLNLKIAKYLEFRQSVRLNDLTIDKFSTKKAAIEAFTYCDQTIKTGIANGHSLYKNNENTYSDLIAKLK